MKRIAYIIISMLLIVGVLSSCNDEKAAKVQSNSKTTENSSTEIISTIKTGNKTKAKNHNTTTISSAAYGNNYSSSYNGGTLNKKMKISLYSEKEYFSEDTVTPEYFNVEMKFRVNKKSLKTYKEYPNIEVFDYEDGLIAACCKPEKKGSGSVKIPETIGGKPVIGISGYYDKGSDELKSALDHISYAYLPKTIKYIDGLTVDIGNMVYSINVDKDNPYYYSKNGSLYTKDKKTLLYASQDTMVRKKYNAYYDFYISKGVENIAKNAFGGYDRCEVEQFSVHVPASVKKIECDFLPFVRVSKNNKYYSSYNAALYDKNKTILLNFSYLGDFYTEKDYKFVLPKTTKYIDKKAFNQLSENASFINELVLPKGFEKQDEIFKILSLNLALDKITVDKDNPYYTSVNDMVLNKEQTEVLFYNYVNHEVKFPDSVKKISDPIWFDIEYKPSLSSSDTSKYVTFGKNVKEICLYRENYDELNDKFFKTKDYERTTVIKGYKGTSAEEFAKRFGLKFIALD